MTNEHNMFRVGEVFTDDGFSCFVGLGGVLVSFKVTVP